MMDSSLRCLVDYDESCEHLFTRLALFTSLANGERMIGVGMANRQKQRTQTATLALHMLCQSDLNCAAVVLHTEATVEDSLAAKPTFAEMEAASDDAADAVLASPTLRADCNSGRGGGDGHSGVATGGSFVPPQQPAASHAPRRRVASTMSAVVHPLCC